MPKTADPYFRFFNRVLVGDGCWERLGYRTKKGYGQFRLGGRMMGAHRAAWMLWFGNIPNGMHVLHNCDNPPCVRPGHLRLGNDQDNQLDAVARGRHHRASRDACSHGHPYTADNTRLRGTARICRQCQRVYKQDHHRREYGT